MEAPQDGADTVNPLVPAKLKVTELKEELSKRSLPVTGTKPELVTRLVQALTHDLTVTQLKELLKLHNLPVSGTKPELLERIVGYLSGSASAPSSPPTSPKKDKSQKEVAKVEFVLTPEFDPLKMPIKDIRTYLKGAGFSTGGRFADLQKTFVSVVLADATSILKARDKPVSGTKAELVKLLTDTLLNITPEPEKIAPVDINTAALEVITSLPGIGPTLGQRIVDNRPYKDIFQVKEKVPGFGAEKLKAVSHLFTGWILDPASVVTDLSSIGEEAQARVQNHEFKIRSWNIRNISNKKSDENLEKIAQIASSFDFFAVQEVRDTAVMERLVSKLGPDWDLAVSEFVGTDHHKERYGFLWRKNVVQVLTPPELLNDVHDNFVRQPFIGYFKAGNFDFVIATIHVVWGATVLGRREEVQKLNDLLAALQKRANTEKDLIIVGDFNLPPTDMGWQLQGWEPLINDPLRTVVGDTSLYDNIWISTEHTAGRLAGCIAFDKIMYGDTKEGRCAAIREVSDHRPVWALFSTEIDDDENVTVDLKNLTL